jgi:hypothetical protein
MTMVKKIPLCQNCAHFFITWDKHLPYGCKAMGFKSKDMPYLITSQVSGEECLSFLDKKTAKLPGM